MIVPLLRPIDTAPTYTDQGQQTLLCVLLLLALVGTCFHMFNWHLLGSRMSEKERTVIWGLPVLVAVYQCNVLYIHLKGQFTQK